MEINKLITQQSSWLSGEGKDSDIILSSRIRLARNVENFPFTTLCSIEQREELCKLLSPVIIDSLGAENIHKLEIDKLDRLDKRILVERHLISPDMESEGKGCAAIISKDEQLSIMLNEEDHLRIQCIKSGLHPQETWETINKLDNAISNIVPYSYSSKYGFLTSCPTNTGTALRVSVLIHLPALSLTKSIDEVLTGVTQLGLSVRGFYGEGSEVLGNLFQISNHSTLGKSEPDIIKGLLKVINQIVGFEREASENLMNNLKSVTEDKIWRAYGILHNARLITSNEFMSLSSAIRLGIAYGIIKNISLKSLNQLMFLIQPAHIQKYLNLDLTSEERDGHRANIIRDYLKNSEVK